MVGRGRAKGDVNKEPDAIYRYFRVYAADTHELKQLGATGGPRDKAECLFCGKRQSCQKHRLLSHIAGLRGAIHTSVCLGPRRQDGDTEEVFEKKQQAFRFARETMRTRHKEEQGLKRKAQEVRVC